MKKLDLLIAVFVSLSVLTVGLWYTDKSEEGHESFSSAPEDSTHAKAQATPERKPSQARKPIAPARSLDELNNRYPGGDFQTQTSSNGQIHSLLGTTSPFDKTKQAAREFIVEASKVLNIDDISQLKAQDEVQTTPMGSKYYFDQRYNGIEVYGGSVSVLQNENGQIFMVNNLFIPNVRNVDTTPRFTYKEAEQLAAYDAGKPIDELSTRTDKNGRPVPVIKHDDTHGARLAWMVRVTQLKKSAVWLYFFDAITGAQLGPRVNEAVH